MPDDEDNMRLDTKITTQCPQCGAQFEVSMAQLQLRKGFVRCVHCAYIFDGYATVVPEARPADASAADTPAPTPQTPPPTLDIHTASAPPAVIRQRHTITLPDDDAHETSAFSISDTAHPQRADEPVWHLPEAFPVSGAPPAAGRGDAAVSVPPARSDAEPKPEPLPDFLEQSTRRRWVTWCWGVLCLAALGVLLVQAAVLYRVALASQFPATRPMLERLCHHWGCGVSYPRALDQITILASSLRMQPQGDPADKHLILHLTLRNQAGRDQQWPHLRLDLTDFSGSVVIRKHLAPADYLPAERARQAFAAGSEIALRLPLRVEGANVNGYQLTPFFP